MHSKKCLILIVPVFACLLTFFVLGMYTVPQLTSSAENRQLMQMPVLDTSNVSKFTQDLSTYVVEQFPFREDLLKAYSFLELMQRKKFSRETYIAQDAWLMTASYRFKDDQLKNLSGALSNAVSKAPQNVEFYYTILPIKSACFASLEPNYIDDSASEYNRKHLSEELGGQGRVKIIDVSKYFDDSFDQSGRKAMYFHTDYHWNALGAYNAADYIQKMLSSFGSIKTGDMFSEMDFTFESAKDKLYQGDLNRRFSNLFDMKEQIPIVTPRDKDRLQYFVSVGDEKPVNRSDIVGSGLYKDVITYNDAYTGNLGYCRIVNDLAPCGKKILIFKDSYEDPMGEYFASIFKEVQLIDLRYYSEPYDFSDLINKKPADIVMFMFHQNNCSQELIDFLS